MNKLLHKNKNILSLFFCFMIYFFTNCVFILKYLKETSFNPYFGIVFFVVIITLIIYFLTKFSHFKSIDKISYWSVSLIFFLLTIYINETVKEDTLNVDRWLAMELGIESVLKWEYIYDVKSYMGNYSSNLPGLILLGMPFYFIFGSVAYLQSIIFLLLSFTIFIFFKTYRSRLITLSLLIFSPAYLYEIYVKSDLFSNFALSVVLIIFMFNKIKNHKFSSALFGFVSAFLLLTRVPIIIPLLILFSKPFINSFKPNQRLFFVLSFILTITSLLGLVFLPAKSWEVIVAHNPFLVQNRNPILLNILMLVVSVFISFKVKNITSLLFWSGTIIFLNVLYVFGVKVFDFGFEKVLYESYFDLSHFNMAMPFVIITIGKILSFLFYPNKKSFS